MQVKLVFREYKLSYHKESTWRTEEYAVKDIRGDNCALLLHLDNGEYKVVDYTQIKEIVIE